jgi:hypothetical protein
MKKLFIYLLAVPFLLLLQIVWAAFFAYIAVFVIVIIASIALIASVYGHDNLLHKIAYDDDCLFDKFIKITAFPMDYAENLVKKVKIKQ